MKVPSRFRTIVGGASAAAGAVGIPGAFSFGSDVAVLKGIWVTGTIMIANKDGLELSKNSIVGLAASAIIGAAVFISGSKLAAKLFHLIPGPGTLAAIGVNSFLDAFFTYRFLSSVAKVFDKYDTTQISIQILKNSIKLFNPWTFFDDVEDMKECIVEGLHLKHKFQNA